MNDNEKYQKDAMRKYIQKLENQETKIVSTPQTELDKELKKPSKFFGFEKKETSLDLFSMWHESCMVGLFSLLSMLC